MCIIIVVNSIIVIVAAKGIRVVPRKLLVVVNFQVE